MGNGEVGVIGGFVFIWFRVVFFGCFRVDRVYAVDSGSLG